MLVYVLCIHIAYSIYNVKSYVIHILVDVNISFQVFFGKQTSNYFEKHLSTK